MITLNNPTQIQMDTIRGLHTLDWVKGICGQIETGEGTGPMNPGTRHLQACILLRDSFRWTQLKSKLQTVLPSLSEVHLDTVRQENRNAAIRYCQANPGDIFSTGPKRGTVEVETRFSFGEFSGPGTRSDLAETQQILDEALTATAGIQEVATRNYTSWLRNYRALAQYSALYSERAKRVREEDRFQPLYIVLRGKTGKGKSSLARSLLQIGWPHEEQYIVSLSKQGWFDGAEGSRVWLWDDFGPGTISLGLFKNILDVWDGRLAIKGGTIPMPRVEVHIFTTNYEWTECWPNVYEKNPDQIDPVLRRFREFGQSHKLLNRDIPMLQAAKEGAWPTFLGGENWREGWNGNEVGGGNTRSLRDPPQPLVQLESDETLPEPAQEEDLEEIHPWQADWEPKPEVENFCEWLD